MVNAVKGATPEELKKAAKNIGAAISDNVTLANLAQGIAHPMDTASKGADAVEEAIKAYREGDLKNRQKQYHDAAQNPNNTLAMRTWSAIQEAATIFEDKGLEVVQDIAGEDQLTLYKSNVGGMEDLYGRRMTATPSGPIGKREDDEDKKNKMEIGSRPTPSGDAGGKDQSMLSAAGVGTTVPPTSGTASKPARPAEGLDLDDAAGRAPSGPG